MQLWLLLTLVFIGQESISTSGVLLTAYQAHYNIWLIHLLFLATTAFDFAVGYWLGVILRDRLAGTYIKRKFDAFNRFEGEKGSIVALILYAPIVFPVSAIFIPWLDMPVWKSVLYMFIGETVFWYLYVWLLVLGASSFAANVHLAFYAIVAISIGISLVVALISRKK